MGGRGGGVYGPGTILSGRQENRTPKPHFPTPCLHIHIYWLDSVYGTEHTLQLTEYNKIFWTLFSVCPQKCRNQYIREIRPGVGIARPRITFPAQWCKKCQSSVDILFIASMVHVDFTHRQLSFLLRNRQNVYGCYTDRCFWCS